MDVWTEKNAKGESRYIKGNSSFCYITKDKKGALENIPEGFEVVRNKYGNLQVRRKK
jgi:hypothetical protein